MRASLFYSLMLFLLVLCHACKEDAIEAKAVEDKKRSDEKEATFVDTVAKELTFLYEKKYCLNLRYFKDDTLAPLALQFGLYERRGDSVFVDCPAWESNAYRRIKSRYFTVQYGSSLQFDGIKNYVPVMSYNQSFVREPAVLANEYLRLDINPRSNWCYVAYNKDTLIISGKKIKRL